MFFAESIEDAANIRSSTDAQGRTQLQRQAMAAPGTVAAAEQADQAADEAAPSLAAAKKGAEKKAKKAATSKKAKVEAEGEAEAVATKERSE